MPKIVDHDIQREDLLNRSFTLFAEKGYAHVTMRQIADELGVSTGTLYHYFPNKQAILEQLFQMVNQRDVTQVVAMMDGSSTRSERIQVFLDFVRERKEYFQGLLLITIEYLRHCHANDSGDVLQQFADFYRNAMAENLQVPQEIADFLLIYLNGLMYHIKLFPRSVTVEDQVSLVNNMIECMLEGNPVGAGVRNGGKDET